MSIRVFLVDDEPDMRMLVRLTLDRTEDIEVVGEASSGTDALEQLAGLVTDVLLLDQMMPGGLTGIETAERLFAAAGTAAPLMILFTAWATDQLREQATSAGIHRFLSKDDFSAVASTIRELAASA
jgi:DNA-binding NarL/FixJ family response regulator